MEKGWFNSMLAKDELDYGCRLSKSMDSLGPIENTGVSEDPILNESFFLFLSTMKLIKL
ncbi:hypothetical protein I3760_03G195700 [Carya illinoinensis]|nr:hypothetical protein I3760_03G195700 [Carya illinoinensis]